MALAPRVCQASPSEKRGLWRCWRPRPCQGSPSWVTARVPRAASLLLSLHGPKEEDNTQQGTPQPPGWGRSTNGKKKKKKELLYKPQILPSQLMCKDRKGEGGKAAAGISENNMGSKKREGGRRVRLSPVVVSPFRGEVVGKVSDQPDLKPDKTISTCQ